MPVRFLRHVVDMIKVLIDSIKKWGTRYSLWPVHLVTACCGVEFAHAYAPAYDAERFGSLPFQSPRQTNLIVVEGTVTLKMARALRMVWEQMSEPKYVISMGSCGAEGGVFWNSYHVVPVNEVVPVDSYVAGCPPTPEALVRGIIMVQEKIAKGKAEPTTRPKTIDLATILPPQASKQPAPNPPHRIDPKPKLTLCVEKEVNWELGGELRRRLAEAGINVVIVGRNRLCIRTSPGELLKVSNLLRGMGFDHVKSVNAVDIPHEGKMIVEYWVSSYTVKDLMSVLVNIMLEVPRDNPRVPSLAITWPSADYLEREIHEYFGVWFEGNPWMGRNFLLDPDTPVKYPLRKDVPIIREFYLVERSFSQGSTQ